jgi:beta-lactamase regulating signal transducer with metallopeptidase domain
MHQQTKVELPVSGTTPFRIPSPANVLVMIWLLGFLVAGLRFILACLRLRQIRSAATEILDDRALTMLHESCRQQNVRRSVGLLSSADCRMPMTWGAFTPVIMLPESFLRWSDEQLKVVLLHEIAHTSRMDPLAQTISGLAAVIGWFHPLAWLMGDRLRRDAECAADDLVLANGTKPSHYPELLMNLGTGRSIGFSGAMAMASPPLTSRIRHILAANRSRKGRSPKSSLIIAICGACALIPVATIRSVSTRSQIIAHNE